MDQPVDRTRQRASDGECYVAVEGGRIVATATFGLVEAMRRPPEYARPGMAYFTQFAVEPGLQGTGLGSRLLRHVEGQARERGAIVKTLSTTTMLDKLGKLYNVQVYETT